MRTSDYRAREHNAVSYMQSLGRDLGSFHHHIEREREHQPGYTGTISSDDRKERAQFKTHEAFVDALIANHTEKLVRQLEVHNNFWQEHLQCDAAKLEQWCRKMGLAHSPQYYIDQLPDHPELLPEAVEFHMALAIEKAIANNQPVPRFDLWIDAEGVDGKRAVAHRLLLVEEEVNELLNYLGTSSRIQQGSSFRLITPNAEATSLQEVVLVNLLPEAGKEDIAEKVCEVINTAKHLNMAAEIIPPDARDTSPRRTLILFPKEGRELRLPEIGALVDHVIDETSRMRTRQTPTPRAANTNQSPQQPGL